MFKMTVAIHYFASASVHNFFFLSLPSFLLSYRQLPN
ncbi:unnamed protein product [Brugia timori]|uniref:Uncharacterized protein n=1 Tax=Brugia timori TaxID=42155 RepID=A0A0R3R875_9BILA|nr:unnamed protein product [Brugia timori]